MGSLILYDNLLLCQFTVEMHNFFANFNFLQSSSRFFTAFRINLHALNSAHALSGLSLGFDVAGESSCSSLVNNLFFCHRSQGANL